MNNQILTIAAGGKPYYIVTESLSCHNTTLFTNNFKALHPFIMITVFKCRSNNRGESKSL